MGEITAILRANGHCVIEARSYRIGRNLFVFGETDRGEFNGFASMKTEDRELPAVVFCDGETL